MSNDAQCALGRHPRPAVVLLGNQHSQRAGRRCYGGRVSGIVDAQFVAEANLGAPFQVDSGRVGQKRAKNPAVRDYAHLMVITHIPVVDALNTILKRKRITPPPDTLLHGAYDTIITMLTAEHGVEFDRDYVVGQIDCQKGNTALFQNEIHRGTDPDLKAFARQTLPKIENHLQRALQLAESAKRGRAAAVLLVCGKRLSS
jgi:putative membrane protein